MDEVGRSYRKDYGLKIRWLAPGGWALDHGRPDVVDRLPPILTARAHALQESLRWGEPYIFLLLPGVISWMIPLVSGQEVIGGLSGGHVLTDGEASGRADAARELTAAGCGRTEAVAFAAALPNWPRERPRVAAAALFQEFYARSGWSPDLLKDRRDKALQQREIAEEIHLRKERGMTSYPAGEERALLSLIRAGDRRGARHVLNRMLGGMFLSSPNVAVVRARCIELMGYLVRTAVEDSPYLEPLIEKNHAWMAKLVVTPDFESLAHGLTQALEDFIDNIYYYGYGPANRKVNEALDYIARHYTETVRLKDLADHVGLSTYRLSHLMKEATGRTVLQHVHRLRIQQAQRLLEQTSRSCADIAYAVGFGDQSYFIKQFRKLTGIPPLRYRALHCPQGG
jgi:AraC-like DNA-binding protein